jgi:hypothetical protein
MLEMVVALEVLISAPHTSAYVSIRQHTSAYVSIRMLETVVVLEVLMSAPQTSAYVSMRPAYVSMRQHT